MVGMDKTLKEEYKEAFLQIRQVVNSIDPMGLVDWCGPEEYDAEVSEILSKLRACKTEGEIRTIVIDVFTKKFDDPGNLDLYNNVGQDLMRVKRSHSWLNVS
ncbi:DUF1871 family protein [Pontibacter ruber]|uniref:DUF1871 family protein n=1 Tax=Pontibacter ruber TaxID=1343895 RepID=A0ABW5D218_9BACT|nr:DUF1871 family protein [Pontibacter ruber]